MGLKVPIMILQHAAMGSEDMALVGAVLNGHRRHAAAHGYAFRHDLTQYMPAPPLDRKHDQARSGGKQYMNKLHALLRAVQDELGKGEEEVGGIMQADADVLVINPSVAIHDLLPPPGLGPAPLIIGCLNYNGWYNGVVLYHIEDDLICLVARAIALEQQFIAEGRVHGDQLLLARLIEERANLHSRFYLILQT